jgi:hypothetical protein
MQRCKLLNLYFYGNRLGTPLFLSKKGHNIRTPLQLVLQNQSCIYKKVKYLLTVSKNKLSIANLAKRPRELANNKKQSNT